MAVYTRHPVSAPPAAPIREKTGHLALRGWCIAVLFLALTAVGWADALGAVGFGLLVAASAVVSTAVWLRVRPAVQWRRLPWYALAYVLWAAVSLVWSQWVAASALTWVVLAITTLQGLFVATVLTWRELVRALASALKWTLAISLLFEVTVALFVQAPLLPGFIRGGADTDPAACWSCANLFGAGRLQGLWGDANLLGAVALLGIIVFAIRWAARAPRRPLLWGWMALAAFFLVRAASVTSYLALAGVGVVLATVLLMRRSSRPGERTKFYVAYAVVGAGGLTLLWLNRATLFGVLGRSADLDGRERIWDAVLDRIGERPGAGWGFSTPWVTWEPGIDGWIVEQGSVVSQAHSVWLDVLLQLGVVGVVLLGLAYLAFIWRSWFFAVDRPRWDLRADRPYSPLTLLPTLVAAVLLVEGLSESAPLMAWGWMLLVMLAFKIKQSPLIGVGPAEQTLAMERGEALDPDSPGAGSAPRHRR